MLPGRRRGQRGLRGRQNRVSCVQRTLQHSERLTVADEEDDLFRHQDERQSEKDILLRDLRQRAGQDSADMMLYSQVLDVYIVAESKDQLEIICEAGERMSGLAVQVPQVRLLVRYAQLDRLSCSHIVYFSGAARDGSESSPSKAPRRRCSSGEI